MSAARRIAIHRRAVERARDYRGDDPDATLLVSLLADPRLILIRPTDRIEHERAVLATVEKLEVLAALRRAREQGAAA
jgi:hypothetical protein